MIKTKNKIIALINKAKDLLKSYRDRVAINYYQKKIKNEKDIHRILDKFNENNVLDLHYGPHYGQVKYGEKTVQLHMGIQLAELITSTYKRMEKEDKLKRFFDAGDSDGVVLKSLGIKNGVSLNLHKECIAFIKQNGGIVVRGDLEHLPFKDYCFDAAVCFQTIEHLKNPVMGLQELARVTKRLFLSIPWMKRTRINKNIEVGHTFEFTHEDFCKILTYTDFKVAYYKEINIFPRIFNPLHLIGLKMFYFRSFLPKLQFYELISERMLRVPKAVVLDFDGVILESCDIKTKAFKELFKDYPEHVDAIVEYHLKNGGVSRYKKFVYFYNNILEQPISDEKLEELGKKFSQLVLKEIKRCAFVPGAPEFLEEYSKKLRLYIASGTPERELHGIIKERGLESYFKGVYGTPATKTEIIRRILKEGNLKTDEVIFVGDSESDYKGAIKAGVSFVARIADSTNFRLENKICAGVVQDMKELIKLLSD